MSDAVATPERTMGLRGLKDKNVLVTGGSSGIGQAIAVRFAEYGANVAINYLTQPDEAPETEDQVHACVAKVQQEGVRDVLVGGDVSNEEDVVRMVGDAAAELGGLDILVNNAGIQISRPSDELSSARLRQGARGQPARGVHVRPRGDPPLPRRGEAGLDRQHLERPPADPEAGLPRLLGQQGRHAEPDPNAGARVCARAASASTASGPGRP